MHTESGVHTVEVHDEAGVLDIRNVMDDSTDVVDHLTLGLDATVLTWEHDLHWIVGTS